MWLMQMQVDVQSANAKEQIFNLQSIVREGSGFRVQVQPSTRQFLKNHPAAAAGQRKDARAHECFSLVYTIICPLYDVHMYARAAQVGVFNFPEYVRSLKETLRTVEPTEDSEDSPERRD
jgi:hypothetical protein